MTKDNQWLQPDVVWETRDKTRTDQISCCGVVTSIQEHRGRRGKGSVQEAKHGVRRGVCVVADPLDSAHHKPGNQGQQQPTRYSQVSI